MRGKQNQISPTSVLSCNTICAVVPQWYRYRIHDVSQKNVHMLFCE